MLTDPIADMLTRIRNGGQARKATVNVPYSHHKEAIARVLRDEGYLDAVTVTDEARPQLQVTLRYDAARQPVINGLQRVSRPSLRVYVGAKDIPAVRRGLGVSIVSTPNGILADREARRQGVGGEVICKVW
jgi:small subunit ribosomal protein S8